MKNTLKKYSALIVVFVMVAMMTIIPNINAAEPTAGSITIICREQKDGENTNVPIDKVDYRLVKVEDDSTLEDAKKYIGTSDKNATTDENGRVVFDNLPLGRYFVYTNGRNILYNKDEFKELIKHEDFLVDIPMTNAEGNGLIYDVVVEPKVQKVYGNLEITKTDMKDKVIEGVKFDVAPAVISIGKESKKIENVQVQTISDMILTTDQNGKVELKNIPYVNPKGRGEVNAYYGYRIYEKSNPIDNMIVSNDDFTGTEIFIWVDENGIVKTNYTEEFKYGTALNGGSRFLISLEETDNLTSIKMMNEQVNIIKKVKNNLGEYVDKAGVNLKDRITFKITADVPNIITGMQTYTILDDLPEGFSLDRDSITIQGATADGFEIISKDIYTLSEDEFKIIFNTMKMGQNIDEYKFSPKYNSIIVTYDVTLNEKNAIIGGEGNINTASVTYSNYIDDMLDEISTKTVSDNAEVHTGAVKIEKTDKLDENIKLAGAKFKIATSEANAKAGVFVTDENDADIEVTTDEQGQAMIKGLAYADNGSDVSYWLVETQAPKYTEEVDGVEVEKSYNLLKNPVEVKVGKTTHNTAVKIKNGKGLNLPATGGIGIIIFALAGIGIMSVSVILNKKKQVIER